MQVRIGQPASPRKRCVPDNGSVSYRIVSCHPQVKHRKKESDSEQRLQICSFLFIVFNHHKQLIFKIRKRYIVTQLSSQCPFCNYSGHIVKTCGTVYAIEDSTPVSRCHMLIIPLRHCRDFFDMTDQERSDTANLIEVLKEQILEKDAEVQGFNIGINCGLCAGQTIFHAHVHLIPRRPNDTPAPRGGVRGVIPDKMGY